MVIRVTFHIETALLKEVEAHCHAGTFMTELIEIDFMILFMYGFFTFAQCCHSFCLHLLCIFLSVSLTLVGSLLSVVYKCLPCFIGRLPQDFFWLFRSFVFMSLFV